jgi:hypothetical protein
MKVLVTLACLLIATILAGCDMRSDTAKREMEKFSATSPTPATVPTPSEPPIDPAEVIQVDPGLQGETITVSGYDVKRSVACTKLNRVMINGNRNVISIKGACRQIMINGDSNKITSDAAMEFALNGDDDTVTYSRYVNGKRPIIKNNATGNSIDKVPAAGVKH